MQLTYLEPYVSRLPVVSPQTSFAVAVYLETRLASYHLPDNPEHISDIRTGTHTDPKRTYTSNYTLQEITCLTSPSAVSGKNKPKPHTGTRNLQHIFFSFLAKCLCPTSSSRMVTRVVRSEGCVASLASMAWSRCMIFSVGVAFTESMCSHVSLEMMSSE